MLLVGLYSPIGSAVSISFRDLQKVYLPSVFSEDEMRIRHRKTGGYFLPADASVVFPMSYSLPDSGFFSSCLVGT